VFKPPLLARKMMVSEPSRGAQRGHRRLGGSDAWREGARDFCGRKRVAGERALFCGGSGASEGGCREETPPDPPPAARARPPPPTPRASPSSPHPRPAGGHRRRRAQVVPERRDQALPRGDGRDLRVRRASARGGGKEEGVR
jgi:hypothetical protein